MGRHLRLIIACTLLSFFCEIYSELTEYAYSYGIEKGNSDVEKVDRRIVVTNHDNQGLEEQKIFQSGSNQKYANELGTIENKKHYSYQEESFGDGTATIGSIGEQQQQQQGGVANGIKYNEVKIIHNVRGFGGSSSGDVSATGGKGGGGGSMDGGGMGGPGMGDLRMGGGGIGGSSGMGSGVMGGGIMSGDGMGGSGILLSGGSGDGEMVGFQSKSFSSGGDFGGDIIGGGRLFKRAYQAYSGVYRNAASYPTIYVRPNKANDDAPL